MVETRKISVRVEVYRLLHSLKESVGASSVSDVIILLADRARTCSRLSQRLENLEVLVARLAAEVERLRRLLEERPGWSARA